MTLDPQVAEILVAAQQGKLPSETLAPSEEQPVVMPREKALKAFEIQKAMTKEQAESKKGMQTKRVQTKRVLSQADQMEQVIDMMVDQAKLSDELYIKEGITAEELEEALSHYMQSGDEEVVSAMSRHMSELERAM